jgi:hypothetical protein
MNNKIKNPHSYFKQIITEEIQDYDTRFEGYTPPNIVINEDCSISVTYGESPIYAINVKVDKINEDVFIRNKITLLSTNQFDLRVVQIDKNNNYYLKPLFINSTENNQFNVKMEYNEPHCIDRTFDSRLYYTAAEMDEIFLSKQEFFNGLALGLGVEFGIAIMLYVAQYYLQIATERGLFPLQIAMRFGSAHGFKAGYLNYDKQCIYNHSNKRTYFNIDPKDFKVAVKITRQEYFPFADPLPPRLFLTFEPCYGGRLGDRGLAWDEVPPRVRV